MTEPHAAPADTERLSFVGSTGASLAGVLHPPAGEAKGSVLLSHCFTCGKDLHTSTRLARALATAGYAALRFDFTGLGESEGDFTDHTVASNVGDLTRAATALIERGYGPCGLLGHSLGGAAALLAAERLKTVRSVVVLGAPSQPAHVRHLLADAEGAIRREGEAVVEIAGRPFPISEAFLDDLEACDTQGRIAALDRPLLVVHAVDDAVVPVAEGERIFAQASQPKGFWPVLGADHLLSDRTRAATVAELVVDWFDATL